jgi:hypothetical protein
MSAETQKVDVLAVMRQAVGRLRDGHPDNEVDVANDAAARGLHESIDAVAELIEAATAMEQDLAELDRLQIRVPTATRQRAYALRNALARVGGAA